MSTSRSWRWHLPRLFMWRKDGGPESNTFGFWLLEWKPVCSIGLLRFAPDVRANMHGHAFNALGVLLTGELKDCRESGDRLLRPGGYGLITRDIVHKIKCLSRSAWMFTVRGPWVATWPEITPDGAIITLGESRTVKALNPGGAK